MNSLDRAIRVLEKLGHQPGGLTNAQICRFLGIRTSSGSYLLTQMEREGFLQRDAETGRYEVGYRLLALANGALRATSFREHSVSVMYELSNATQLSVAIGVLDRKGAILLDRVDRPTASAPANVEPAEWLGSQLTVGSALPILATATGKILLASLSRRQVTDIFEREQKSSNNAAPPSFDALLEDLRQIARQGFAAVQTCQFRSIGAPIKGSMREVYAALSVTGHPSEPAWRNANKNQIVGMVQAAATEISKRASSRTRRV